jgi:two-component system response regulator HydG
LHQLAPRTNPAVVRISDEALACLWAYPYPGNVRELENLIEQALVFAEGDTLLPAALPAQLRGRKAGDSTDATPSLQVPGGLSGAVSLPDILDDLERQLILRAYREAKGVKTETARLLGIKPSALYYKLEKYQIS